MFTPSVGFYNSFFKSINIGFKKNRLAWIQKDLPILIMGGKNDPVTNYGKGLHKLQAIYSKYGLSSEVIAYENMRHEILNENGKEKVYNDILTFIDNNMQNKK